MQTERGDAVMAATFTCPRPARNRAYAFTRMPGGAPRAMVGTVQPNLLRVFIMLVVGNALIGSVVLLAGGMDGTGGKVFATSLLATVAMLGGVACSTGLQIRRLRPISVAGIAVTGTGFALTAFSIWVEISADWFGRLTATMIVLAVVAAGISLFGLASLAPRHRWLQTLGLALAAVLAADIITLIWFSDAIGDWYLRVTGVIAVAVAACALVIPALHRVAARERRAAAGGRRTVAFCPSCGASVTSPTACDRCGASFVVRFAESGERAPTREPVR